MNIKERVKASLKWKESAKKCAKKLGLSEEDYLLLRSEVRAEARVDNFITTGTVFVKEDVDKGTKNVEAISTTQPKSPEELEKLFTFDKAQWKLSSYWSKQRGDGKWLVSALITRLKQEELIVNDFKAALLDARSLSDFCTKTEIKGIINESLSAKTCAVISMQDIHIGKLNMDSIETVEEDFKTTLSNIVLRAYHSHNLDKIVFVLGGDLINMDTFLGTTTSGTPIDNSMSAYDAYKIAFDLMSWAVKFLKEYCNELEVVYIPGNHSRLSEAHVAYGLSKAISDPGIIWNVEYETRKVITYGNSMLCFEHGDFDTRKSFFAFATEFSPEWGKTVFRTLYTGHFHKEKTSVYVTRDETNGFTIKILPSLSKTDRFHHNGKWTNNKRGGVIQFHSLNNGCTGEFSHFLN